MTSFKASYYEWDATNHLNSRIYDFLLINNNSIYKAISRRWNNAKSQKNSPKKKINCLCHQNTTSSSSTSPTKISSASSRTVTPKHNANDLPTSIKTTALMKKGPIKIHKMILLKSRIQSSDVSFRPIRQGKPRTWSSNKYKKKVSNALGMIRKLKSPRINLAMKNNGRRDWSSTKPFRSDLAHSAKTLTQVPSTDSLFTTHNSYKIMPISICSWVAQASSSASQSWQIPSTWSTANWLTSTATVSKSTRWASATIREPLSWCATSPTNTRFRTCHMKSTTTSLTVTTFFTCHVTLR